MGANTCVCVCVWRWRDTRWSPIGRLLPLGPPIILLYFRFLWWIRTRFSPLGRTGARFVKQSLVGGFIRGGPVQARSPAADQIWRNDPGGLLGFCFSVKKQKLSVGIPSWLLSVYRPSQSFLFLSTVSRSSLHSDMNGRKTRWGDSFWPDLIFPLSSSSVLPWPGSSSAAGSPSTSCWSRETRRAGCRCGASRTPRLHRRPRVQQVTKPWTVSPRHPTPTQSVRTVAII